MAGLLYFKPGTLHHLQLADTAALGLAHAFDTKPTTREVTGRGPAGVPGNVFADPRRMGDLSIGHYPASQTWHAVPTAAGADPLWVGWYTDSPPTPGDLARTEQLPGATVRLADGRDWLVPIVQQWLADGPMKCALPQTMRRTAAGPWVAGEIVPLYRAIWEAARNYWQVLMEVMLGWAAEGEHTEDTTRREFDFDGMVDFACELLAVNYRLSWIEISALELFTTDDVAQRVVQTAVDWPTFEAWLQKKTDEEHAGESSSPGAED